MRADLNSAAPGVDLVNIDASNGGKFLITNDLQTFSETMPRWSSDGVQVIYAAASANAPENNDIFTRRADGSGSSLPLYRHPSNDIYPIFSRDARYMAVASNRTGNYDIFIYDTVNQTTAQLTNAPGDEFPGGWWQP